MNLLADPNPLRLRPLPPAALAIVQQYHPSPRLLAHLRLVHDVAASLCAMFTAEQLLVAVDVPAIGFGAATHDIGKIAVPEELSHSGNLHEQRGAELLLQAGVPLAAARFTQTHGSWRTQPVTIEDLIVALADTCWKGTRDAALEQRIADDLAQRSGRPPWDVWLIVDTAVEQIAMDADRRLHWHASFPVAAP